MLVVVAAKMKKRLKASSSSSFPFIVYKNFPHTNELLEYDQHLKLPPSLRKFILQPSQLKMDF